MTHRSHMHKTLGTCRAATHSPADPPHPGAGARPRPLRVLETVAAGAAGPLPLACSNEK